MSRSIILAVLSVLVFASGFIRSQEIVDLAPGMGTPDVFFDQVPRFGPPGLLIEYFGVAVAEGDFNGDGFEDMAISGASPGPFAPFASVYVFYGRPVTPPLFMPAITPPPPAPPFPGADVVIIISGPAAIGFAQAMVAGDANGDGIDDLFIAAFSAPLGASGPTFTGLVKGLAGPLPSSGAVIDLAMPYPLLLDASGASPGHALGAAMTMGDFAGDGSAELVIAAPGAGALFVIDIPSLPSPAVVLGAGPVPGVTAFTPPPGSLTGFSTGDLDGDGADELVIAAPGPSSGMGTVFVLDPGIGYAIAATLTGPEPGAFFGFSTACGDVNGDSIDDLVVGAPGVDAPASGSVPARMDAGAVYVFTGPALGVPSVTILGMKGDPDGMSNAPAPTLDTHDPGGLFGSAVGTGDTDGDGRADVVVGAPYEDGSAGFYTGRTWLLERVLCGPPVMDLGVDPSFATLCMIGGEGTSSIAVPELFGDFLGYRVGCADFDGDGRDDPWAAAPNDPFISPGDPGGKVIMMLGKTPDPILLGSTPSISLSSGGSLAFDMDAGAARGGDFYLLVASASGRSPGTVVGSVTVPLNYDHATVFTLTYYNTPILPDSFGILDACGHATSSFIIPPTIPAPWALALTLDWAYITIDRVSGDIATSHAIALTFMP